MISEWSLRRPETLSIRHVVLGDAEDATSTSESQAFLSASRPKRVMASAPSGGWRRVREGGIETSQAF